MAKMTDLTNKVFGRLTVKEISHRDKHGFIIWRCECECGGQSLTRSYTLKNGMSRSCGCLRDEVSSVNGKQSGDNGDKKVYNWLCKQGFTEAAEAFKASYRS